VEKDTEMKMIAIFGAVSLTFSFSFIFGLWLFVDGFFPDRPVVPPPRADVGSPHNDTSFEFPARFRSREDLVEGLASTETAAPVARFSKVVVVLVDSLRASFLYGNDTHMHFTRHLLDTQQAVGYVAMAHAPTVTLPRLKALMSGTIANYLDLLRNFDTQRSSEDNLLDRLRDSGRKLVFYGDDTWLKLFPGRFDRFEGTTSFYVADTVEVDNNVTRNLMIELTREDWHVMVLHYLGLDHIGHSQGASSPLMPGKQREMDGVVATVGASS
jgi:ethanolaminephosphotransferase